MERVQMELINGCYRILFHKFFSRRYFRIIVQIVRIDCQIHSIVRKSCKTLSKIVRFKKKIFQSSSTWNSCASFRSSIFSFFFSGELHARKGKKRNDWRLYNRRMRVSKRVPPVPERRDIFF